MGDTIGTFELHSLNRNLLNLAACFLLAARWLSSIVYIMFNDFLAIQHSTGHSRWSWGHSLPQWCPPNDAQCSGLVLSLKKLYWTKIKINIKHINGLRVTSKQGVPPYASKHQGEGGCRNPGRGWVSCRGNARVPHDELFCFQGPNVPLSQTHVQSPWESCDRHKFEVPHITTLAWAYGQCTDIHPFLFWDSSGLLSSVVLLVNEKYLYWLDMSK